MTLDPKIIDYLSPSKAPSISFVRSSAESRALISTDVMIGGKVEVAQYVISFSWTNYVNTVRVLFAFAIPKSMLVLLRYYVLGSIYPVHRDGMVFS